MNLNMKNYFKFAYFIIALFFMNCNTPIQDKKNEEIVIIYNTNIKDSLVIEENELNESSPIARYRPVITYSTNELEQIITENVICYDSDKYLDTVIIKSSRPIILKHKYNLDDYYYLFNPGDTLIFDKENSLPTYKNINENNFNHKFSAYSNSTLSNNYISNSISYYFFKNLVLNKNENSKYSIQKYFEFRNSNLKLSKHLLDSLKKIESIDDPNYTLLNNQIKFDSINLLFQKMIKYKKENHRINEYNVLVKKDSLLQYDFYKDFLKNYVNLRYDIQGLTLSNASVKNSLQAFDSTLVTSLISERNKIFLLSYYLDNISRTFSTKKTAEYFEKLNGFVKDSSLLKGIEQKYLLDISVSENSKNVMLLSTNDKKTTLKSIIEENKGKIIYVDFWASWCSPCKILLPYSKKLQVEFQNENVVFLYISIDKRIDSWKKAVEGEGLSGFKNNYLAMNYPKAFFFKDLNLKTIPRYLIFNQNGELIHKDALNPDDPNISIILKEYLKY